MKALRHTHVHVVQRNTAVLYLEVVARELQERVSNRVIHAVDTDAQKGVAEARQSLERGPVEEGGTAAARISALARVSQHLHELSKVSRVAATRVPVFLSCFGGKGFRAVHTYHQQR